MKRPGYCMLAGLWGVTLLGGCGVHLLQEARDSAIVAKGSGAEAKAPFEYYAAEAYLEIAEDEWAEWDWKAMQEWAMESTKYSGQALKAAQGGGK